MAPVMGPSRPAAAAAPATQTITLPPQGVAVRDAVRGAVRDAELPPRAPAMSAPAPAAAGDGVLCFEEVEGRRWSYVVEGAASSAGKTGRVSARARGGSAAPVGATFRAVPLQSPLPPAEEIMSFIRSYVVPEGFPDSVTPSYVPYMTWRALKHFFGGAMSVFTTRALLNSVGVSQSRATSGAVAINWILKDGAGRVGKMLFARQGKKFDYDLKQLRFSGDLMMELGAGIELATAAFPQLFLPLACMANVVKNVAAVTSTSTRTPIYKAYAKGENIGDVTAKGESVGNIADLVRSVVLNTLNTARFTVAVDSFIKTGHVPSLKEGNLEETIFNPPWRHQPVAIGSRFGEAFQEPASFVATRPLFEDERYIVTYNPAKDKVYALLKDQAKQDDILKAAFHAHVLLHFINASHANLKARKRMNSDQGSYHYVNPNPLNMDFLAHIEESCKIVTSSYGVFKRKAREQDKIFLSYIGSEPM
uniref:Protein root UVB sensitive 6 n=1 Tax=Aegilops tauschii TaxID=37682 RepID=R7WAL5_AEGTA